MNLRDLPYEFVFMILYREDLCTVKTIDHQGTTMGDTGQCGSYPCMDAQIHPKC